MKYAEKIVRIIDKFSDKIGYIVGWLTTIMVLVVFYDTFMRYVFQKGNVALQELEWFLFSIIFLIGAAYTLKQDGHVRVDIIYLKLSDRAKAWIDLIGTFVFLIPFSIMVIISTKGFVINSWNVKEISPDPGGLPAYYILKAMIPLGFSLLIVQGFSEACKSFMVIMGYDFKITSKRQKDKE